MDNSRTKKSIRNTIVALVEQGIYTVMSFLCRTVFIYSLGKTYLGFSGISGISEIRYFKNGVSARPTTVIITPIVL